MVGRWQVARPFLRRQLRARREIVAHGQDWPELSPGQRVLVPVGASRAFGLRANQTVRLIDTEGQQVIDVYAVVADDPAEGLSGICTTQMNRAVYLSRGHALYSTRRRPILTIVEDTVGRHDLLMGACSEAVYTKRFDAPGHANCQALLQAALTPLGIRSDVADTFNAFMNVPVGPDGELSIELPRSQAGDSVSLRAEIDCLVAVTPCPADLSPCNGWRPTPIEVELITAG
jgi:uncharacterized protein